MDVEPGVDGGAGEGTSRDQDHKKYITGLNYLKRKVFYHPSDAT